MTSAPRSPEPALRAPGATIIKLTGLAVVLSLVSMVGSIGSPTALGASLLVAIGLSLALIALPALLWLWLSVRRPAGVALPLRRGAMLSAVCLLLLGAALAALTREPSGVGFGGALAIVGLAAIARRHQVPIAATPPPPSALRVGYGTSVMGGVVGVLLAIWLAEWATFAAHDYRSKQKAAQAYMKSTLRNVVTAEEAFFSDSGRYVGSERLGEWFQPERGVTVTIERADSAGFIATATHAATTQACGVWVGTPPADRMHGALEAQPTCWDPEATPH